MGAAYDRVVNALTEKTGYHAIGNGNWRCPAHPDNNPSLKVSNGGDRVLINCHANCDVAQILAALDLTYVDLYDEPAKATRPQKQIVDAYPYHDEAGELLYEVVRFDPKGFGQRQPNPVGGWTWNMNGARRVLYRLPQIVEAIADGAPIWIVEGEKDVYALEREGEIATTSPGGAGKWRPEYTESLRGAHVIIVADNDEPGRKHADTVATELEGVVASIERREPAPGHKDIADHLGAGLTLGQLVAPKPEPALADYIAQTNWEDFWANEAPVQEWLIEPLVPVGRQVALYAAAKAGKSLLSLEVAAAAATGQPVLDRGSADPIHVVYIDQEMTEADLRERLIDLGYGPDDDLEHLHYYQLTSLPALNTELGGAVLAAVVDKHQAQVVVIDTMARVVKGDENDADPYRDFYYHTGLQLKARGVSLLRLDHEGKDTTKGQRGSSAKVDDVDVVFRLTAKDDNVTLRRTHTRVPWVPAEITLTRETEPNLRHKPTPHNWPAGTYELAQLLDELGVPLDATATTACTTLKAHKQGKRRSDVVAAIKWRKENA